MITQNWRAKPLTSFPAIVSLISVAKTATGLKVHPELDTRAYSSGIKVTDRAVAQIDLKPAKPHCDWNYEIRHRKPDL